MKTLEPVEPLRNIQYSGVCDVVALREIQVFDRWIILCQIVQANMRYLTA